MSPFRFDVLGLTVFLALPVLLLGAEGHLTVNGAIARFLACWVVATILMGVLNAHLEAARLQAEARRAELQALLALDEDEDADSATADVPDPVDGTAGAGQGPSAGQSFGDALRQNSTGAGSGEADTAVPRAS